MLRTGITLRTDRESKEQCDSLFSMLIPFEIGIEEDTLTRIISRLPEAGSMSYLMTGTILRMMSVSSSSSPDR